MGGWASVLEDTPDLLEAAVSWAVCALPLLPLGCLGWRWGALLAGCLHRPGPSRKIARCASPDEV